MATVVVDVREVKNISKQIVSVIVKEKKNSEIFPQSGNIKISPEVTIVAEDNRFDLKQLQSIERKKLIKVTLSKRAITAPSGSGSGSGSGSA